MRLLDHRKLALLTLTFSISACSGSAIPSAGEPVTNVPSASLASQARPDVNVDTYKEAQPGNQAYNDAILALYPEFYYETNETSGWVALDSSANRRNGVYVTPVSLAALGCCGNLGVSITKGSVSPSDANPQVQSPVSGESSMFAAPFAVGVSIAPAVQSYPGYGTYWYAGTDNTENGTGNGWDFNYGNNNLRRVAGYNLNWGYGGRFNLLYEHTLLTGNHQWVINVTSSTISLYLDGAQVANTSYSQPFQIHGGRENLAFGNSATDSPTFNCACTMSSIFLVPKALTSDQVSKLEDAAKVSTPVKPTPPPTASPAPTGKPTAAPGPTPTPVSGTPISYNSASACINHKLFTNNVLPANVGEFATSGFDRNFWGGTKSRTESPTASWGPGFYQSWGRHQYDTNMGDPSQGPGFPDPFAVVNDQGTQALQIAAYPVPAPIATSLDLMQNDQYIVANAKSSYAVPQERGTLTVNVDNPNGAQNGWKVGVGFGGAADTFIGTLTSGGATPSGNGTGGSNPWTITNIHVYSGTPGTVLTPSQNPNNNALRSYNFPAYYSGTLDANINQEYGFFVARLRLPQPAAGISPAFWMLETGGVKSNQGQLMRSEWDIEEQFAADYGYDLNAGNILWNSGDTGKWYSYGCGISCGANGRDASGATGVYPWPSSGDYNSGYHDYGVLVSPGGPAFPTNYSGSLGGTYTAENSPYIGTTFFIDGVPVGGHIGAPDLTQDSPDKEIMLMFQIGAPGTWLDPNGQEKNDVWPKYLYAQWLRAYKPSAAACT
jgi:hypothetical protein